ncbi:MAG: hypothetical protein ACI91B_002895, partial [Planctomycetota bacterium]
MNAPARSHWVRFGLKHMSAAAVLLLTIGT